MGLQGQIDKHPLRSQTNPQTGVGDQPAPNHVDIVRFGPKGALTALKHVYLVKRSLYIYSDRNILPYPMWDITMLAPPFHAIVNSLHS